MTEPSAAVSPASVPGLAGDAAAAVRAAHSARLASVRAYALVGGLALVVYGNALAAGFVFDDWVQIWAHPALRDSLDWSAVLAAPLFPGDLYRPLTVATFFFDTWLVGRTAWWFHSVNVTLHVITSILVAVAGSRLFASVRAGFLAGALFAVHPIHTEAVTGIVGRAEILAACLGLAAVLAAARAAQAAAWARRGWFALSVATFCLAVFAKEHAILWLPLMLLYRAARRNAAWMRALGEELRRLDWVAWAACIAAYLYLRHLVVGPLAPGHGVDFVDNVLAHVPTRERVATALAVLADYASQLLLPLVLSADYSYPQIEPVRSLADARLWIGAGLIALAVVAFARRPGPWGYAAVFPLVALSLTANLLFPIGTVRAERLLYLPSVGVCWLAAAAFDLLLRTRQRRAATAFLVVLLAGYSIRTGLRNQEWKDQATLFAATARDVPLSSKAHKNHAVELQRSGQLELARQAYLRAWKLYPNEEGTAFGLGTVYEQLGDFPQALAWYRQALAIEPGHRGAHQNLCRLLIGLAEWQEAEAACRGGLRVAPAEPNLWKGLALAWQQLGRQDQAREAFLIAARLDPQDLAVRKLAAGEGRSSTNSGERP